ncbi:MAG TPA: Smr/MutS family protein [Candidatus Solibacter sp.]|nr:Smr/MutS family protein [Candidatus Solibacter sp.]
MSRSNSPIKTANLKSDRPSVDEALRRLEREIALARRERLAAIKVIHGYGSTGAGGEIRIAVQKRLHELAEAGEIGAVIFGEDWSKSDERSWNLLQAHPELKADPDVGRHNAGVSVVIL